MLGYVPANLAARVQAGVELMDLQVARAKQGLFFPPDPQSILGATLGGMIAENAGGPGASPSLLEGVQELTPSFCAVMTHGKP